jgi:DNA-binding response OmpR family regulator
MAESALAGLRVLLAEDEYLIAFELHDALIAAGADVIGPFPTLRETIGCVNADTKLDLAVLDVNLRGEMVFPVADALDARGVPFVFATGYDQETLPERFAGHMRLEKPLEAHTVAASIAGLLKKS